MQRWVIPPEWKRMYRADDYDPNDFTVVEKISRPNLPKHIDMRSYCPPVIDNKKIDVRDSSLIHVVISCLEMMMNISVLKNDIASSFKQVSGLRGSFDKCFLIDKTSSMSQQPSYRDVLKLISQYGCNYSLREEMTNYRINEYARLDACGKKVENRSSQSQFIKLMKSILASGVPIIGSVKFPKRMNRHDIVGTGFLDYHNKHYNRYNKLDSLIFGVLFVGYDDNLEFNHKKGWFIFQNSWGKKWGDAGFGYIHYKEIKNSFDFWIISSFDFDCLASNNSTKLYYNTDDPSCLFEILSTKISG